MIEILISSAIFAVIMVMATAIFSMTSSYNSKIREIRTVTEDARSAASSISDDVRLANGEVNVTIGANPAKLMKDIFLIRVTSSGEARFLAPEIVTSSLPVENIYGSTNYYGLGVIQKNSNKVILYRPRFVNDNYQLYREEFAISESSWNTGLIVNAVPGAISKVNSDRTSIEVRFSGYGVKVDKKLQPYIRFQILAQTENFNSLQPTNRFKLEIKSTVESRDYN